MTIPSLQLTEDRNRQFDDWGITVTLREVTQSFNPQTQQASESYSDTQLTAIVGNAPSEPTPGTAGQHLVDEINFAVKSEDIPSSQATPTRRMIYQTIEYDILSYKLSADGLVYLLHCRKTS